MIGLSFALTKNRGQYVKPFTTLIPSMTQTGAMLRLNTFLVGGITMKIPVISSSASLNVVNSEELDDLLRKNALLAFHRSDGWVRVGFDDIRDPDGRRESSWKDRKALRRQRSLVQS